MEPENGSVLLYGVFQEVHYDVDHPVFTMCRIGKHQRSLD